MGTELLLAQFEEFRARKYEHVCVAFFLEWIVSIETEVIVLRWAYSKLLKHKTSRTRTRRS